MNTNRSTKRMTNLFCALFALSILLSTTPTSAKNPDPETGPTGQPASSPVYDATGAREDAIVYSNEVEAQVIPVTGAQPVPYDAAAAMRASIVYSHEAQFAAVPVTGARSTMVYDATAAIRASIVYAHEVQPKASAGSFYDATSAMRAAIMYSHEVQPTPAVALEDNSGD